VNPAGFVGHYVTVDPCAIMSNFRPERRNCLPVVQQSNAPFSIVPQPSTGPTRQFTIIISRKNRAQILICKPSFAKFPAPNFPRAEISFAEFRAQKFTLKVFRTA
jgi:hypothetical protein